jgi:hypothetical protein
MPRHLGHLGDEFETTKTESGSAAIESEVHADDTREESAATEADLMVQSTGGPDALIANNFWTEHRAKKILDRTWIEEKISWIEPGHNIEAHNSLKPGHSIVHSNCRLHSIHTGRYK